MERLVQLLKGEEPKIAPVDDEEDDIEGDLEPKSEAKPVPAEESDDEDMRIEEI